MKAIKSLIITIIVIVAIMGVAIIGGYIYVRSAYGIDLFNTAGQLKTLSQKTDEKTLCPKAFSASDMADVKTNLDKKASGLIIYEDGKGYEGYTVDFSASSLTPLKEDIGGFPFSLFKKYVPDELYVSSTVRVNKTGDKMGYNVTHVGLKLNNLSAEDTADLFHTLDAVLKIGSAENLNMQIGTTAVNALIGNADHSGFAYSMQALGKTAFGFANIDEQACFVIY